MTLDVSHLRILADYAPHLITAHDRMLMDRADREAAMVRAAPWVRRACIAGAVLCAMGLVVLTFGGV